jgi:hypothetical protein
LNIFGKYKNIIKCHWTESTRGPAWPGSASASAAHAGHGLAQLGRREAAGESTTGPHRRVDGGAAELVAIDGGAWAAQRGVDGGAWAALQFGSDLRGTTVERLAWPGRRENAVARRTHRCVGWGRRRRRSGRRRRAARGERPGCRGVDTGDGAVGTAACEAKRLAVRSGGGGCRDGRARSRQRFKARRGHVAATRRRHADRRARRGKRRLTSGPLMSAISELKFTPG